MLKYQHQDISKEVKHQTALLQKANLNFENTGMRLVKIEDRLDEVVASLSFCKLWTIICAELFLILIVLLS